MKKGQVDLSYRLCPVSEIHRFTFHLNDLDTDQTWLCSKPMVDPLAKPTMYTECKHL